MEPHRFTFQSNQFNGECLPCPKTTFYTEVNRASVYNTITTRQAIEKAIDDGQPLDNWINCANFRNFCLKQAARPRAGETFVALPVEQKLQQWTNSKKMWLPDFIFGVREFAAIPKTNKDGDLILDNEGKPILFRRRLQSSIRELSCLFMFDGDHLPINPREVYERTLRPGFPWIVRLSHQTSSGHGIRLVCEANPDVGNIADNQIELARELGLLGMVGTTGKPVTDDSCIDASRISYAPRMCDIFYIDEDKLFNF